MTFKYRVRFLECRSPRKTSGVGNKLIKFGGVLLFGVFWNFSSMALPGTSLSHVRHFVGLEEINRYGVTMQIPRVRTAKSTMTPKGVMAWELYLYVDGAIVHHEPLTTLDIEWHSPRDGRKLALRADLAESLRERWLDTQGLSARLLPLTFRPSNDPLDFEDLQTGISPHFVPIEGIVFEMDDIELRDFLQVAKPEGFFRRCQQSLTGKF